MAVEIERKFLVRRELWRPVGDGAVIAQGYLSADAGCTVRVRIRGEEGFLTVKGKNLGIRRAEFEYGIPLEDAKEMLALCRQPVVRKRRYLERHGAYLWEIDVFEGANEGLVLAEVELSSETEEPPLPEWAGEEVSDDPRYYSASLSRCPYSAWGAAH